MATRIATLQPPTTSRPSGVPAESGPAHFLTFEALGSGGLRAMLDLTRRLKQDPDSLRGSLAGGRIGMIFDKPSTRTRLSFAAAAWHLGMLPNVFRTDELQLGRGETVADTARTFSLYLDAVTIRTFAQATVEELAAASSIPVINALTDDHHPCQALADVMTIEEEFGGLTGRSVAFVGDGDNVCQSLVQAAALGAFELRVATPPGYEPSQPLVARARQLAETTGGTIRLTHDPVEAVADADAVYADVWTSMGHESERRTRLADFAGFTVDGQLLAQAAPHAIFLHCLPAHRGEEVTDEVIDGPRSRVWPQAENRFWTQTALLYALITGYWDGRSR